MGDSWHSISSELLLEKSLQRRERPPSSSEVGFGGAKEHEQSCVSPGAPREVQVSEHCKQRNALKGTAENTVSNQQHLMSQDAVGISHQEYIQEIRNMAVIK